MNEYFPNMGLGPHAEIISPYFQHVKALLSGSLILGDIKPGQLKLVAAKNLYMRFSPPKITYKYDIDWNPVWWRLQNPLLDMSSRDIMFMVIQNIVANKDLAWVSHDCFSKL